MRLAVRTTLTLLLATLGACDRSTPSTSSDNTEPVARETPAPDPAAPATGPAHLSIETREIDFGSFLETEERRRMLPFTNTGTGELVINDISSTCGCTIPRLEKRRYAPGESGEIEIVFDPTGPGEQTKHVTIVSNTVPAEVVRVAVTADVRAFLNVEPPQAMLGVIPLREKKTITFTLSSSDPEFELVNIKATNPLVKITWQPHPVTGTAGPEKIIDVELPASMPWGNLFSWLYITIRGRPTPEAEVMTYQRKIRIQGQVFGELHADPDTFRFGATPGETFERVVRLWRPSGEPFRILGASMPSGRFVEESLQQRRISPSEYELVLRAVAPDENARITMNVTIQTDVPGEEEIVVRVVGRIRP